MNQHDIQQLENLCNVLYSSTDNQERNNAGQTLYSVLENPDNFRNLYPILSMSSHPQLVYLSLSALTKLVGSEWKHMTEEDKNLLFQNLFQMLFAQTERPSFVYGGIAKALARVCRLGWLEYESFRLLPLNVQQVTEQNYLLGELGFKLFEELVSEMLDPVKSRTIQVNRKTALNFRDEGLKIIFGYCVYLLGKVSEIPNQLVGPVLLVLNQCLTFDFLGISADETSEDSLCLQIPYSWKDYFENPQIIDYLCFVATNATEDNERLALRALNHVGAVRKSIFKDGVQLKSNFIQKFVVALDQIMKAKNLESDSLFEFVSACKRFTSNFNFKEYIDTESFECFLKTFSEYSLRLFCRPSAITSDFESGIVLWSHLIFENYYQNSQNEKVGQYIFGIFKGYVHYTLENVSQEVLDDCKEENLKDNLESLGKMATYHYSEIMREFQQKYQEVYSQYEVAGNQVLEAKLAWLIYIASALVGLREKKTNEAEEHLDSQMIGYVFQLVQQTSNYLPAACLEVSVTYFFLALSKSYINSPQESVWYWYERSPGQVSAQNLNEETLKYAVGLIIEKVLQNITKYSEGRVVYNSLVLFENLAKGYYSNKVLLSIDIVRNLIVNYHNFELCSQIPKYRERLFAAIANLWLNEEVEESLEDLLSGESNYIHQVVSAPSQSSLILVFRELKGICSALQSSKHYTEFFEWFKEGKMQVLHIPTQNFIYEDPVMDSLLSFLNELVHNSHSSRIRFDVASANGVILFKNTTEILIKYGKLLLERPLGPNPYELIYKKIVKLFRVVVRMMMGGYVNFGVFEVYGDTCFVDCLRMCFVLLEKIPEQELASLTKLKEILYQFIEQVCKLHLKSLFTYLPGSCYSQLVDYLLEGIRESNIKFCTSTGNSLAFLSEYIIKKTKTDSEESQNIKRVLNEHSSKLSELLEVVLEVIINEESNYMWSLSKPLLGLVIVNQQNFQEVKNYAIARVTNNLETQQKLNEGINALMQDVTTSLDAKNKDRFSRNFSEFRKLIPSLR